MRVLCLADIHSDFASFDPTEMPDADVCLVAGDITEYGHAHPRVRDKEIREAASWLRLLGERCPTFVIPGNHDIGMGNADFESIPGVTGILNRRADCLGFSLYGVSLSPTYLFPRMARLFDHMTTDPVEEESAYSFEPVDIVLSHSPPSGYLDRMREKGSPDFGPHIGSEALLLYIAEHQPSLVVCGHVHNDPGEARIGRTLILNVAKKWRLVTLGDGNASVKADLARE